MDYLHVQADNPWYNYYVKHVTSRVWKIYHTEYGPFLELISLKQKEAPLPRIYSKVKLVCFSFFAFRFSLFDFRFSLFVFVFRFSLFVIRFLVFPISFFVIRFSLFVLRFLTFEIGSNIVFDIQNPILTFELGPNIVS